MSKVVILPSAKLVPVELQAEFGPIPSAMIPLDGRPAMSYIAGKYLTRGYSVVVAINQGGQQIQEYLSANPHIAVTAVDVGETKSLGETVCEAVRRMGSMPTELVINFADTFIDDDIELNNTVCYAQQRNTFRWTTFDLTEHGQIVGVHEKYQEKQGNYAHPVFIGVFSIGDADAFSRHLTAALKASDDVDPFYRAVRAYFNRLPLEQKRIVEVRHWWDFGHLDTYHETRRRMFVKKRFFNSVLIDEERGVLRKESKDTKKFLDEIAWYLRLPKSLQHIAPRIFDYSLDVDHPYLEMEYYGYPVLSDVYLYGAWDHGAWVQVFSKLAELVARMNECRFVPKRQQDLVDAMDQMYVQKTRERLKPVLGDSRFDRFRNDLVINGFECFGLEACLSSLTRVIDAVELYTQRTFSIAHGDLCLSNILYDPRNRIIRLIDPRGLFGSYDIYGDPRYDLAKLSHSIEGDYDFYTNGLFDIKWHTPQHVELRPHLRPAHEAIKRIYRAESRLAPSREVRLIESLLFLSMVPLHMDRPLSQEAFLARGLLTYSEIAKSA